MSDYVDVRAVADEALGLLADHRGMCCDRSQLVAALGIASEPSDFQAMDDYLGLIEAECLI